MKTELDPAHFRRRLLAWYRAHRRDLPWRRTRDPYRVWISEVMLQQTPVRTVLPYYSKWLETYPDIDSLAGAPLDRILKLWEGLGYYQRAKNLHEAARRIVSRHGGIFPRDYAQALALPGIGPYISAAVLSIAYDAPHAVLDANVRRLMMRLDGITGPPGSPVDRIILSRLAGYLPSHRRPGDFNQAMMELGALICRPRRPRCGTCPLREGCTALSMGLQDIIPPPRKRVITRMEAAVGVLWREGRIFIQKRSPEGLLGDLWEFPGGKLKSGEDPETALRREIREELGIEIGEIRFLTRLRHDYTRFQVTLHAFLCTPMGLPRLIRGRRRWTTLRGLRRYAVPSATARLIRFLELHPDTIPDSGARSNVTRGLKK